MTKELTLLNTRPRFDKEKIRAGDRVLVTEDDGYEFEAIVGHVHETEICVLEPVAKGYSNYIIEAQEYADGLFKIEIIKEEQDGE
ncbi:MAG: hypothetical protein GX896_08380 [Clostridiales bacterium]|nr:hypothetical protein [Clostridiales bacterium]